MPWNTPPPRLRAYAAVARHSNKGVVTGDTRPRGLSKAVLATSPPARMSLRLSCRASAILVFSAYPCFGPWHHVHHIDWERAHGGMEITTSVTPIIDQLTRISSTCL